MKGNILLVFIKGDGDDDRGVVTVDDFLEGIGSVEDSDLDK